jgi:anti-anti-sigma factor
MPVPPNQLINVETKTFGTTVEIIVEGEIDVASVAEVAAPIGHTLGARWARLVIDLEQVEFLETTCVRLLERTARRAADSDIDFVVIPPRAEAPRHVLDIAGIKYVPGQRNRLGGIERVRGDSRLQAKAPSLQRVIDERRRLMRH